jgi:hypothetical protein
LPEPDPTLPPELELLATAELAQEPVMGELPPTEIHVGACLTLCPLAPLPEPDPTLPPELELLATALLLHESVIGELPPTVIQLAF